ncbi:unnamed protein product [Nyctereutes procyonoides]|uniref:(raccoon dog) hypothetical protein n=1 Tax=Nyctereutes procyonoides TaxID=34880 RepID=A0A811Z152_NYCPR|nr:unnamed protein product [Nyctereutes procyonoides]
MLARRQTRAPLSRPAVPPGVGRALPRSPTPPRVPAPFPAAAPRPGPSPERPGGAGGQSPGLEAGRPRPDRARPLGAPRRAAPPTRRQEGGLGTAWRQGARGRAGEVRSDHVGAGTRSGREKVTITASFCGAGVALVLRAERSSGSRPRLQAALNRCATGTAQTGSFLEKLNLHDTAMLLLASNWKQPIRS